MKRNLLLLILVGLTWTTSLPAVSAETAIEAWVRRFNTFVDASDEAYHVATDNSGNVIVAGVTDEGVAGPDILIIKYSSAGTALWTNRYDGPGHSTDRPAELVVDGSGNVVVAGYSVGQGSGFDFITLKYSSAGTPLWTNRYNGPGNDYDNASALALDSGGNVIVTGYATGIGTSEDYTTIKYSGAGVALWTNRYNGPGNASDYARKVAVDGSGNVYVTGASDSLLGSADFATVAYSSGGTTLWVSRYDGPENDDDGAMAIAAAGSNVVITGYSYSNSHDYDYVTIRYTNTGAALWTNRYNGPGDSDDEAFAVALAGTNVYVTGFSDSGTSYDYATIKYSLAGTPLWTNRYDGPANGSDEAYSLAVDGGGNVYVTGNSSGGQSGFDFATVAYASDGSVSWITRYNGPRSDGPDYASSVATDAGGNVLVAGRAAGVTSDEFVIVKYSNAGAALWTNLYNGLSRSECYPQAVTADSSGNIIVTGDSRGNGTSTDYATVKYSGAGVALWTNRYSSAGYVGDEARAVTTDSGGNVYVTGLGSIGNNAGYVTIKYSSAGLALWTNHYKGPANYSDFVQAIAVDASGKVFVTGYSEGGSGFDCLTVAYSTTGTPLWTNRYDSGFGSDYARGVVVDGSGNVIVTGYISTETNGDDFVTIKYSNSGLALWTNRYDGPINTSDQASALAVDGSGNVIVTGFSYDTDGVYYATVKYSSAGAPLWTNRYAGPAAFHYDLANAVAVDGSGNVYVTGTSRSDTSSYDQATVKYSSGGTPMWTNRYDRAGNDDVAFALGLDGSGRVYIAGYSYSGGSSGADFTTIAYSGAGVPLWTNWYNGPFNGDDQPLTSRSLAVIGNGSVVVVGTSPGNYSGNGADFAVVNYVTVPQLSIRRLNTNSATVSWPWPSTGFLLQERSNFTSAAWTMVSTVPSDDGTNKMLTVSPALGNKFYRLVKP